MYGLHLWSNRHSSVPDLLEDAYALAWVTQTGVEAFIEHEWIMRIARLSTSGLRCVILGFGEPLGPSAFNPNFGL